MGDREVIYESGYGTVKAKLLNVGPDRVAQLQFANPEDPKMVHTAPKVKHGFGFKSGRWHYIEEAAPAENPAGAPEIVTNANLRGYLTRQYDGRVAEAMMRAKDNALKEVAADKAKQEKSAGKTPAPGELPPLSEEDVEFIETERKKKIAEAQKTASVVNVMRDGRVINDVPMGEVDMELDTIISIVSLEGEQKPEEPKPPEWKLGKAKQAIVNAILKLEPEYKFGESPEILTAKQLRLLRDSLK